MDKEKILKKMFTSKEQIIYNRTQLKRNNTFVAIGKDLWISKQAVAQSYEKIKRHLDNLYIKLK